MSDLFGMPPVLKLVLGVLVLIGLVAAIAWLVRRFGASRFGATSTRGRQPRLAVVDGAPVDAKRRLILVRRDNVEHLLMIGGPTDVLVEQNIVRAVAAGRDAGIARTTPNGGDGLRPFPTGEAPLPLSEPEPPSRAPRSLDEGPPRIGEPYLESGSRPSSAPEASPASQDLSQRRAPARELNSAAFRQPPPLESARTEGIRSSEMPRMEPPQRPEPARLAGLRGELPRERNDAPRTPGREPRLSGPQAGKAERAGDIGPATDQNLAQMAQRLEAALRRPAPIHELRLPERSTPPAPGAAEPVADPAASPRGPRAAQVPTPSAEAKDARAEIKPAGKTPHDSLEEEMASLLGRPGDKP